MSASTAAAAAAQPLVHTIANRTEYDRIVADSNKEGDNRMFIVALLPAKSSAHMSQQRIDAVKQIVQDQVPRMDRSLINDSIFVYMWESAQFSEPIIRILKEGERIGEKSLPRSKKALDEKALNTEKNDLTLFLMSQFIAHKHFLQEDALEFEDDEEEDEEEEAEGDDDDMEDDEEEEAEEQKEENGKELLKKFAAGEVGAEDDEEEAEDEDYEEMDEEGDDEEEEGSWEDVDEEEGLDEEEGESGEQQQVLPRGLAAEVIPQEDIAALWQQIASEKFAGDALAFLTFRNAMSDFVRSVFFKANPVQKALADIAHGSSVEKQDLDELAKEAQELGVGSEKKNPEISDIAALQTIVSKKLQKQRDLQQQGIAWTHDTDHENLDEEELAAEDEDSNVWLFGAEMPRLQVGSWSAGAKYAGQFRIKVDVPAQSLVYDFFTFEPEKLGAKEERNIHKKEPFSEYMLRQADRFKSAQESRLLTMTVSLRNIEFLQYHESEVDPGLALLVVDVAGRPSYAQRVAVPPADKSGSDLWESRADFSESRQVSKIKRHLIVGEHKQLKNIVGLAVLAGGDATKQVYANSKTVAFDAAAAQPEFAVPIDEPTIDAQFQDTSRKDQPFPSSLVPSRQRQEQENCVIM